MNIEEIRDYCLAKPGTTEDLPFDEVTLVFKVFGKIFLLTSLINELKINLKNTPEKIVGLQEEYASVYPGYHMNKKHWITVHVDGTIADSLIYKWIDESYNEVVKTLPKKFKDELNS